jgi:hypothetical protein
LRDSGFDGGPTGSAKRTILTSPERAAGLALAGSEREDAGLYRERASDGRRDCEGDGPGRGCRESLAGAMSVRHEGETRSAALALLASRAPGATICPSEVARSLAARAGESDWRAAMPAVHSAVDSMVAAGLVRLSWKGEAMAERKGPYRIGLASAEDCADEGA